MANEARPCPCDLGDVFAYEAGGQETQIGHIKAYVSKPASSSDKAVIVVQDIYGWQLPNTRFMADLLTSHGYIAVCPDFFAGQEPWKPSNDYSTIQDWLKTRPATKADRELEAVMKYLKEELGVKKVAIIGFCWGGIVAHYAMLKFPELKAGVSFYGIIRDSEDRYDLLNPTLFIFAENDPVVPLEQVTVLEERLKAHAKVAYKVKVFPKQTHGFAHRRREDISPDDRPHIQKAREDLLQWLHKYVV